MGPRATVSTVNHISDSVIVWQANRPTLIIPSSHSCHSAHEVINVEAMIGRIKALSSIIDADIGLFAQLKVI